MKIAYLIQAHKNIKQIEALISCLNQSEEQRFFVHIDKKNDTLYRQLVKMYCDSERVNILEERVVVSWSGFSQVKASLLLMKNVYQSDIDFDRVHLMSGEDFPVKSSRYILAFLTENRDKEFIEFEDIGRYRWRVMCYNFFTEYSGNRTLLVRLIQRLTREIQKLWPERKHLRDLNLFKGSSWFNISIEAMEYILQFLNDNPTFLKQFYYTSCADEHFFQILLLNSAYKGKIVNNNLYYIEWFKEQNSPNYLTEQSIKKAQRDKNILFVRKINQNTALKLVQDCE